MTTTPVITTLIDKVDEFERIRDQIGNILAANTAAQQALATAGGKDPDLWKLRIFTEAANPWENTRDGTDLTPIVNIWVDNGTYDEKSSNISQRQKSTTTYNVDCYGFANSAADGAGHKPGDKQAALEAQRAYRLVRNILMSAVVAYLGLRDNDLKIWKRWIRTFTFFQPQIDSRPVQNVIACRIAFDVDHSEESPQGDESNDLQYVAVDIERDSDDELLAEVDFDWTP